VIDDLTSTQAVWLFCPAFVLHVLEESLRFTDWPRLQIFTRRTLMVLSVIAVSSVAGASSKSDPVNHGRGGIAILGYDPVAYFTDSKPLKGDSKFSFPWHGAVW